MTRFATLPQPQPSFSFSWSRIKNFETCPRRYWEIDIEKNYVEKSDALDYGFRMHHAAAQRVSHNIALPKEFEKLEKWIQKFTKDSEEKSVGIQTELKLAIDRDNKPVPWFSKKAYYRGVIDFLKIRKPVALVVDWKSGQMQNDIPQLGLFAQLVFAHYPWVRAVKLIYVWIKEDDSNEENLYPKDMIELWEDIGPRVKELEKAHLIEHFPPKKSGLCKAFCPVVKCEFNGRNKL
jgi:hypothetical protein